jgi:hypothetical protein
MSLARNPRAVLQGRVITIFDCDMGGGEVVLAFCRLEEIADVPDLLAEGINGPDSFGAEMGFKLCEGHLDWIKVRAVGRQEQHPCTPGLDGFLGGLALMGRQIIHDHDIVFFEDRRELGFDIGLEDAPVHWRVDAGYGFR